MKKLIAVLSVLAVVSPVVAQNVATPSREGEIREIIAKYDKAPVQESEMLLEGDSLQRDIKIVNEIGKAFGDFRKAAYNHQYYEYDVMFQLMDNLRASYMEIRGQSKRADRVAANKIYSTGIEIANGDRQITIGDYVRMEVVNLMPTEQEKFEAFLQALEEDKER